MRWIEDYGKEEIISVKTGSESRETKHQCLKVT